MNTRGPLNKSLAGATVALRDEMHERRRCEWCDRGERSSVFRRKMRPRSGMLAPRIRSCAVITPRRCPIPLHGSLGQRFGASFATSLTKQITRKALSHLDCSKIRRRPRREEQCLSEGRCDPEAGCWHPRGELGRDRGTRRCPIPLCGSLGRRSGVPLRCAPWRRSPSYDLRCAPRDHPNFDSNALCGGFAQRFPRRRSGRSDNGSIHLDQIDQFHRHHD